MADILMDLYCENVPFHQGHAHQGMAAACNNILAMVDIYSYNITLSTYLHYLHIYVSTGTGHPGGEAAAVAGLQAGHPRLQPRGGRGRAPHHRAHQGRFYYIQLGQPSVNPPRLVLEVGGTLTKQAAMPGELKSPPLGTLKWGDFNFTGTAACKVEVPPTSSTSLGGFTLG